MTDPNGWRPWTVSKDNSPPVSGIDRVIVMLRSGEKMRPARARSRIWGMMPYAPDLEVVAWKPTPPAQEGR